MNKYMCAFLMLVLLVSCTSNSSSVKSIGETINVGDGLKITAMEYTTLPSVFFTNNTQVFLQDGTAYHAVAVQFEKSGKDFSTVLDLTKIVLITKDGQEIPALTLTTGPGSDYEISDLAFYNEVGEDGSSLDFGVTTSIASQIAEISYQDGMQYSLQTYHAMSPLWLTFVFQVPDTAAASSFRLMDLGEWSLTN